MKYKVTKKEVMQNRKVLAIGYCGAQYLLRYEEPIAYTSGAYGWNCDVYQIGSITVTTGYRPIGNHVSYEVLNKYEALAREASCSIDETNKKQLIKKYLFDFLKEVSR